VDEAGARVLLAGTLSVVARVIGMLGLPNAHVEGP
jgi:hypothetical protein